jgi:hypothetical protein
MSWASEAVRAIRKIVLIEDRMGRVAKHVDQLAETCQDLDRRLLRLEAKFELITGQNESIKPLDLGHRRRVSVKRTAGGFGAKNLCW